MKKIVALSFLLFVFVLSRQIVFADVSPAPAVSSDYQLPYPGLLPDNPLYLIKTLRDKIVTFFISDPLKKSSFYLLQSDKRFEATWYLLKKNRGEQDLAISTLTKSTNYLSQALDSAKVAKKSGENVNDVVGRLRDASNTHLSLIHDMELFPGISAVNKKVLSAEFGRVAAMQKSVIEFSNN